MKKSNVSKLATIFVFCKSEDGQPLYVKDVRKWVAIVDELKLEDSVEIEGSLFLALDLDEPGVERITCGECNSEDFLIEVHDCEEETAKLKQKWEEQKEKKTK